jgi:hypothetical protein
MKISIDQGLSKTGVVLWRGGKPVDWMCFKKPLPKGMSTLDRCRRRWAEIQDWIIQKAILEYQPESLTEIILEDFIKYVPAEREYSVRKLNQLTYYLLAKLETFGGAYPKITLVNKGRVPKEEATMISIALGIPKDVDQDVHDACYHGVLAGADK